MEAVTPSALEHIDVSRSEHYSHLAATRVSATTGDGRSVKMRLGETSHQLSDRQADLLAQGLLMALLRAGQGLDRMPWIGALQKVTPYDGQRGAIWFSDDTWYGLNPTFSFMGIGWMYEGTGADPDYPNNVVCIQTLHDDGILLHKGNDQYLLTSDQAYELCISLSDSAYGLKARVWRIWDRVIEWSVLDTVQSLGSSADEHTLFEELKNYPSKLRPVLR